MDNDRWSNFRTNIPRNGVHPGRPHASNYSNRNFCSRTYINSNRDSNSHNSRSRTYINSDLRWCLY